jgi:hypothetical protein|tara:strand:+ start:562 stop:948 length:387 start_codon:yes stop_codon:yes gene_type:complete
MNLSEILSSINHNKENILRDRDEREEKQYAPYVINRCLSYFPDTIFLVNSMNCIPNVDKRMHYEFLLTSVRKRKRFSKWLKKEQDIRLDWIKEYYNVSEKKAREYISFLTDEQIEDIKSRTTFGDKNK